MQGVTFDEGFDNCNYFGNGVDQVTVARTQKANFVENLLTRSQANPISGSQKFASWENQRPRAHLNWSICCSKTRPLWFSKFKDLFLLREENITWCQRQQASLRASSLLQRWTPRVVHIEARQTTSGWTLVLQDDVRRRRSGRLWTVCAASWGRGGRRLSGSCVCRVGIFC